MTDEEQIRNFKLQRVFSARREEGGILILSRKKRRVLKTKMPCRFPQDGHFRVFYAFWRDRWAPFFRRTRLRVYLVENARKKAVHDD